MTTSEQYANNKADREAAEALFKLIDEGGRRERFWSVFRDLCAAKLPQTAVSIEKDAAMSEAGATNFEAQRMLYGKYQGKEVGTVPCGYLLFLTEGDDFTKQLKRYCASARFKQRQDEEDFSP